MTRDEIIRMAREAGAVVSVDGSWHKFETQKTLERFAVLVAEHEREKCAKVCDTTPPYPFRPSIEAAHAIRARSKE